VTTYVSVLLGRFNVVAELASSLAALITAAFVVSFLGWGRTLFKSLDFGLT
jgi:hypothetical protein